MEKIVVFIMGLMLATTGMAQDIYQVAELNTIDLNGTARYVGMGGAMGALGGDISVMSSNPAAIGLYRRSDVAVTGSLVARPGTHEFDGKKPTYVSFDQLGFVYSWNTESSTFKFFNVGFNYHKQHDFNQLLNAENTNLDNIGNASQTWQLADLSNYWSDVNNATPLAQLAYDACLLGENGIGDYDAYNAWGNSYGKARWGSNQAYDFNFAFNLYDQYYFGITATAYNIYQRSYMLYSEGLLNVDGNADGWYDMDNTSKLFGTGFDVKLGFVVRPIIESNFKIGLTLITPTWYELNYRNELRLASYTDSYGENIVRPFYCDYDYNVRSPWKIGLSLGNTFFNRLAVGAEYEFADYSSCSVSYDDDYYYVDEWGWGNSSVSKDRELNHQIDNYLKCTHTLKIGAEIMITPNIFVRGGYNHVSSAFDKAAWLNHFINSASVDVATNTDYLNLGGINRFSAGFGLKFGKFYADATWLYQHQRGTLYAFNAPEDPSAEIYVNACPGARLSLNKSQTMLTLGYKF
ncbi:MAG: hypothetical protein J1F13_02345 [Prevotellaceae bacterium]|nr:hypothetical protein [Prevotellaceae bacterium]